MNAKWIIPCVAAVAAGVVAYGLAKSATCGRSAQSVDRLQDVSFLVRELGLNDAQTREVQGLHTTLGTQLSASCSRHCAARMRLGQALAVETNGNARADFVLEEMCRAYEQSERATLNHIRAVRAVLNAEQRRRFDAMISDCMCQPCSMEGGTCGTDVDGAATQEPREK